MDKKFPNMASPTSDTLDENEIKFPRESMSADANSFGFNPPPP